MKPQSNPCRSRSSNCYLGLLVLALALYLPGPLWADARASLDRTRIYQGDTLTLSIEVDGTSAPQPDLSPLGQDFEVLGTSSGTQISILNGRRSDTTRWQISLRPRHAGELQIPPLAVGAERTRPLQLSVADAASIPRRDAEVFVELQVDLPGGSAYVQQQVPLTVRLYSAQPLRQGNLSDPQVEQGVVERLGEDRRYTADWGGKRYQVLERHYALSPEQSGPLHIPPVVFKGNLPAEQGKRSSRSSSPFDRFRNDPFFERFFEGSTFDRFFDEDPFAVLDPGRPVTVQSEGLDIRVKPKPATGAGPWLPAQDLAVEDSWTAKVPELRVGEPVTRTLTLRARGLSGSQIPQIPLALGDAVRLYPEAPRNDTRTDGNLVYGASQQAFALIPQRAGELRLPEVRVKWWDTRADQEREALIPAITARVLPAVQGTATAPPEPAPAPLSSAPSSPQPAAEPPPAQTLPPTAQGPLWPSAAVIGGVALALLAGLGAWVWRRRGARSAAAAGPVNPPLAKPLRPDPAPARRAFLAACEANDPAAAAQALLAWAAAQWPETPPRSLAALAGELAEGGEAVLALDRVLYAREGTEWHGARLKEALAMGLRQRAAYRPSPAVDDLAPLYPQKP